MENVLGYQRDAHTNRAIILNLAAKRNQVVYGAQSTNHNLPSHLRKDTIDYDILTKQPEKSANELVSKLNKEYGKEKFKVIPAKHPGTFKVKDIDTNETIADYTRTTKKPNSNNDLGVKYANLSYSEKKLKGMLKSEASSFRHDKDFDTLNRIKEGKKSKW